MKLKIRALNILKYIRKNDILRNIGLSFLYKPISIVISFTLIPLTLRYLGESNYGVWATILSIISWINYFDIGIGNGLKNHLAKEITLKNFNEAREYIATSYVVVSLISLLAMIVCSSIFSFLNWKEIFNIHGIGDENLVNIMLLNLFFILINFILKIVTSIYSALQKTSVISLMQIVNQLFNLIGIILLRKYGFKNELLGISLVYGMSTLISNVLFTFVLFLNNNKLIFSISDINRKKIKRLGGLGIQFFIIQIATLIVFTTDNLIVAKLFGAGNVTSYSITLKVFSIITMVNGILMAPIWPAISKARAQNDIMWIKKVLKKLKLLKIVMLTGIIFIYLAFPFLIKIWLGINLNVSKELLINFSLYTFFIIFCSGYAMIFNGLGEVKLQLRVAIVQSIINIPLSIYFAKVLEFGVTGVIMGTNLTLFIPVLLFPGEMRRVIKRLEFEDKKNGVMKCS